PRFLARAARSWEAALLGAAENRAAGARRTIPGQSTIRSGDALQSAASLGLFGGEWNPQVVAGHFFGLRNAQHSEDRWTNVLQRAVSTHTVLRAVLAHHDHGHRIGSLRGMRHAVFGIHHHLGIA